MKRIFFITVLILCINALFSQGGRKNYSAESSARIDSAVIQQYRRVEPFFQEAYHLYPSVPRGVLEAVSFTYTRFRHLTPPEYQEDEGAVPNTYGLMGLTLDGRGFFRDNLRYVSDLSGLPVESIVASPRDNVVAYAAAYAALQQQFGIRSSRFDAQLPILTALSELPLSEDPVLDFALNSSLYAIARFADNDLFRTAVGAALEKPDYDRCFGSLLPRLCSPEVRLPVGDERSSRSGSTDYDGAIWNSAGTCNYTEGRSGHSISAVTIHYTQGTYAGSIAWFQNCTYNGVGARASAHYVVRSIDGQVTQMVREADKAWHVGNCNPYTIGIEHEAYGDIASYFTPEMYQSSARLVRDICDRNGISPHRMFYRDTLDDGTVLNNGTHSLGGESACVKIRGHQHFPNQSHTDPGPYWNWNYYYKLVNDDTPVTRFTAPSGTLTDSGGPDGNYGNDERQLLLIQVDGAQSITLSFSEFDLEDNYDFLWIYDGGTVFSPLLGRWNTTSPGTVTSTGNAILLEFRSDCATTAAGWKAVWQAAMPVVSHRPVTNVSWDENQWVTEDRRFRFEDVADGRIRYRFYQVTGCIGQQWTANPNCGFVYDDFDRLDTRRWSILRGHWQVKRGLLCQKDTTLSVISTPLSADRHSAYLYEYDMSVHSRVDEEGMAGIQIFHTGNFSRVNTYTIAVFPKERQIRLYRTLQGNCTLLYTIDRVVTQNDVSYHYQVLHDAARGTFMLFRDGKLIGEYQETPTSLSPTASSQMALITSGMSAMFDNLHVYRSRGASAVVTVGEGRNCDLQWQAANGVPTAKIRSVIMDDRRSFSDVTEKALLVDYTEPLLQGTVYEVIDDRVAFPQYFSRGFQWEPATDPHSDVAYYEYGIVNAPVGNLDEIQWTDSTTDNRVVIRSRVRLPESFYVAVRAVNGAGLCSSPIFSEECHSVSTGIVAKRSLNGSEPDEQDVTEETKLRVWPNPAVGLLNVVSSEPLASLDIFDACGQKVCGKIDSEQCVDVSSLKAGIYCVRAVGRSGQVFGALFLKQP